MGRSLRKLRIPSSFNLIADWTDVRPECQDRSVNPASCSISTHYKTTVSHHNPVRTSFALLFALLPSPQRRIVSHPFFSEPTQINLFTPRVPLLPTTTRIGITTAEAQLPPSVPRLQQSYFTRTSPTSEIITIYCLTRLRVTLIPVLARRC